MKEKLKSNPNLISTAIYMNSYRPIAPYAHAVGFRENQLRYTEGVYSLAQYFLINSKHCRATPESQLSIIHYLEDAGVMMVALSGQEEIPASLKCALEKSPSLKLNFEDVLKNRRSTRFFTGDPIPFACLSALLRAGSGIREQAQATLSNDEMVTFDFRHSASAGALYPIELYVVSVNVRALSKGIYRYHAKEDVMIKVTNEVEPLLKAFSNAEKIISFSHSSAILLFVGQPLKTMRKYGERGLRFVLHELGAMSQTIHLTVSALGLGSVDCASFYDDEVNQVLKIDGQIETTLHAIVLGTPP